MNRFRSRKKSADHGEKKGRSRRGSVEDDVPPVPSFPTKAFRRNKRAQPEPKPEVDLKNVLPTSDDFRTSLLMPNLSARFSMLREQDDPTSKIGKASDDSVLFPKRASRLDLFNGGNLGDIAEVDSVRGSFRPPFASTRTESYSTDGYGTDEDASRNGSVMSRARPGEGNNLFGGRQKIYKIPMDGAGSVKSFGDKDDGDHPMRGAMGGKPVYDDDVAMSAFQKLREQEKQDKRNRELFDFGTSTARSSKEDERSDSPPHNYNKNRETTSSTNSAPSQSRSSTAATSVHSQKSIYAGGNGSNGALSSSASLSHHNERHGPKGRRLYGNGLDQHMYEQQFSALHRLESVNRQRTLGGSSKGLQGSRSATGLNDRYQKSGPSLIPASFRPSSPPPSASPQSARENDDSANPDNHTGGPVHDASYGFARPMSPPLSPDQDPTLIAALEPNDLGKATASGAFNKPKKQYNEQQYLQRQLQLQQGRETPPPRSYSPQVGSIDEQAAARTRNNSNASSTRFHPELRSTEQHPNSVSKSVSVRELGMAEQSHPDMNGTFFSPSSASEASTPSARSPSALSQNTDYTNNNSRRGSARSSIPAVVQEPPSDARRSQEQNDNSIRQDHQHLSSLPEEPAADSLSQRTVTQSHKSSISTKSKPDFLQIDPQMQNSGNGLSGLVKSHLRNASDQSSIYPEQSPGLLSKFPDENFVANRTSTSYQPHTFFKNEEDDPKSPEPRASQDSRYSETAVPPPLAITAQRMLHQATALKKESPKAQQTLGNDKAQRVLGKEAPRGSHATLDNQDTQHPSWEQQIKAHHTRGGSTETQKEREALAQEMATRSRMIQDNLKNIVEVDSRSASPHPTIRGSPDDSPAKQGAAFAMLKPKSSKGSLRSDKAPKAMKMLGLGPSASSKRLESTQSRPMESDQRQREVHPAISDQRISHEASNSRPSSRRDHENGELTSPRSNMDPADQNRRMRPIAVGLNSQYSDSRSFVSTSSAQTPSLAAPSPSPRPSPGFSTHSAPTVPQQQVQDGDSSPPAPPHSQPAPLPYQPPTMINPPSQSHSHFRNHRISPPSYRKGSISKYDISEPTFVSSTSAVTTVDLPPGASLKNGMEPPPPIPPFNPRRKRTRTLLDKLGRLDKPATEESSHLPTRLEKANNIVAEPLLRTSPPSTANLGSPTADQNNPNNMSRAEREYRSQLKQFQAQHQRTSNPTTAGETQRSFPSSPPSQRSAPITTRDPNDPSSKQWSPPRFDPTKQSRIRTRQRLRKTSSEGANMATQAKQQASMYPVSPIAPSSARAFGGEGSRQHGGFGADVPRSGAVSPIEGPPGSGGAMF